MRSFEGKQKNNSMKKMLLQEENGSWIKQKLDKIGLVFFIPAHEPCNINCHAIGTNIQKHPTL